MMWTWRRLIGETGCLNGESNSTNKDNGDSMDNKEETGVFDKEAVIDDNY